MKSQIKKALDALDTAGGAGGGGGETPSAAHNANAKFYVSVSKVANNTTRSAADVQRIVSGAIASKLAELGEYQLAPAGESNDAAKAAIAKRQLKGYYLGVSVDKLDYSDGNLRVHVKIAVFSYPGRDLRGEVPAGATLPGRAPGRLERRGAADERRRRPGGRAFRAKLPVNESHVRQRQSR